ncbi:MAG: lysine--tRNA ligase [Acidobacteriota bacterium]
MNNEGDHIAQRYSKLDRIGDAGYEKYPHKFDVKDSVKELVHKFSEVSTEELKELNRQVCIAGRITALRGHGKAGFGHLSSGGSKIQFYVRQDKVGEKNYGLFQLVDVGDFIGVSGILLRTRTGELTIFADKVDFLAKALLPLPEKWHGLTDVETRYRQRYLDLIANPKVREIFEKRSRIISELRRYLESMGYIEVETPMMHSIPGGAAARPFVTHHDALDMGLYLRIAPELYLKRLVVGGFDRVFEINRNFRNEGVSAQHNPEFTMAEFYQAYSDYQDLIALTEDMLQKIAMAVNGSLVTEFRGNNINFGEFRRFTMMEAIREYWSGENVPSEEDLFDPDFLRKSLEKLNALPAGDPGWGKMLAALFEETAEDKLIQPTFICDFPLEISPLSKQKASDPRFVDRFELFVGGMELANGFSELNDPEEQKKRFEAQLEEKEKGDLEAHEMDEDYVEALRHGMPPAAGEGIGIDRLVMMLTSSSSIREVILFPHLRSPRN